jgi:hypothetical protein
MLDTKQRIARLHELHDKINELAELEPRLIDDTDWHSNEDAIAQMVNIIESESDKEIEGLAEEALNIAVKHIQNKLGITAGDKAGMFFSDGVVTQEFFDYILYEMEG